MEGEPVRRQPVEPDKEVEVVRQREVRLGMEEQAQEGIRNISCIGTQIERYVSPFPRTSTRALRILSLTFM